MTSTAKYATRRNKNRPTFGNRVAHVAAEVMGTPLMPWQQQVADVAMELSLENPGEWQYPMVIVSVPRQSGKTALMRAVAADRMLAYRGHQIQMTAQTGKDARKRWDQICTALDTDNHPTQFERYASKGSEKLTYKRTGSVIAPFAPTPKSIHGDSLNLVMIDEAWAFDEVSGNALIAAVNPTFATVLDNQLWIVSTKGTAKSAYLNRLIAQGRAAVGDPNSRIAYFEWSADPDLAAADPYSRETLAFHPALGHTQSYDKILTLGREEPLATWKRSYLNLEDLSGAAAVVDLAVWDSLTVDGGVAWPEAARMVLAVDAAVDGSAATICGAYRDGDDVVIGVMETRPGTTWLAGAVKRAYEAGYTSIYADGVGPTGTILDELDDAGVPVARLSTREYASACQWLQDGVRTGTIRHDGDETVRSSLEAVVTSPMAGAMVFNARKSPQPVDSLRALAIAGYGANRRKGRLQLF